MPALRIARNAASGFADYFALAGASQERAAGEVMQVLSKIQCGRQYVVSGIPVTCNQLTAFAGALFGVSTFELSSESGRVFKGTQWQNGEIYRITEFKK